MDIIKKVGKRMIKAVVFDMDGLLFDTEKLYHRFWLEAAAHYGYLMKDEHARMIVSLAAEVASPLLQKEVCASVITHSSDRQEPAQEPLLAVV